MEKKKLSDSNISSLVSSIKNTTYSLDLALDVSELVNSLKNKISEDFVEIDKIKKKLEGVEVASKVVSDLDGISSSLQEAETKVNTLLSYISTKK